MGLIDRGHDKYLEEARTYWRENGIDAEVQAVVVDADGYILSGNNYYGV